jgi:hypothetical protein
MRKLARQAAILAALALAVYGCAQQGTEGAKLAEGEKLKITQEVWSDYQDYVKRGRELSSDRNGAFGVAIIGDVGTAGLSTYYYCPRMYDYCGQLGSNAVSDVLDECRREKVECLIFARNEDILVPYEIID